MYRSRWYSIDQPEGDRRAPSAQCRRGLPRHARTHAPDQGEFRTITADNGTEFHGYAQIELKSEVQFYFATPHHSWERGTNENTNGLIRQYLPKGQSMESVTQAQCDAIATKLNERPRKRHDYQTPNQRFLKS